MTEIPVDTADDVILTINNRQLSELSNTELIVLMDNIYFSQCIDIISKNGINGELLALVETLEELNEFNFPLKRVELKLLLKKIQEFKLTGVSPKYLDHEVKFISTFMLIFKIVLFLNIFRFLFLF